MSTREEEMEDEFEERDLPVPGTLTRELFLKRRDARRGTSNPERMNNPLWEWLITSRWSAYFVNEHFSGPSPFDDAGFTGNSPGWCFRRFGQSTTPLPDGRTILIAGEHEDHYDPDFFIYNDVVVRHPGGAIEIFGYPVEAFPPTDFHSATLVGNRIILIGSLGYPEQRQSDTPPVAILDLESFAISRAETTGTPPGWIYKHDASLSADGASILVRGGSVARGGSDGGFVENIDEWRLHLADWRWERLTERQWQRWELRRKDRKAIHLYWINSALSARSLKWEEELQSRIQQVQAKCGKAPDLDIAARLFSPELEHDPIPEREGEYQVTRIQAQGVVVRYVEDMYCVQMTVEGDLPEKTIEALKADLLGKMEELENAGCLWRRIG